MTSIEGPTFSMQPLTKARRPGVLESAAEREVCWMGEEDGWAGSA